MTKILIADDESNILMLLEIMLRDLNAEIISAENGEIAVEKAIKEKPDLIISDVVMPKKNGFEVCRTIRNTKDIADTPIILVSALGDEYNKLTGFDEGADDYIIKPFNIEDLKSRAQTLLLRHQSKKEDLPKKNLPDSPSKKPPSTTHLCTSIPELNNRLYGGLPKGSNILVVGPTGSGKSSFCRNFIGSGLENKEKNLIIAIDDDPKKIRQSISLKSGKTITDHETQNDIKFVDAYSWSSLSPPDDEPYIITGTLELNQLAGVISDASAELGHSIQKKEGGRRIIDSLSSLLIHFDLSTTQRFINQIARTSMAFGGVTTLFVIEEGTVNKTTLNNIKYIMDGIIEFKKENDTKQCRVSSMKWAAYQNDWVTLS